MNPSNCLLIYTLTCAIVNHSATEIVITFPLRHLKNTSNSRRGSIDSNGGPIIYVFEKSSWMEINFPFLGGLCQCLPKIAVNAALSKSTFDIFGKVFLGNKVTKFC